MHAAPWESHAFMTMWPNMGLLALWGKRLWLVHLGISIAQKGANFLVDTNNVF